MVKFQELKPAVVLGVAAHPDDLDFGAAGTMAVFAEAGADVYYLILTDGGKGSEDPEMSPEHLSEMRKAEQTAALRALGGKEVRFLNKPDGQLEITMDLKREIVRVIRELRPDVVITTDPATIYSSERGFINHPDHRAAGQATLDAVYPLARDLMSFPELKQDGLKPHKVSTVLLINFDNHNYSVNISGTFDKKLSALKSHVSQVKDIEQVSKWMRQQAETIGTANGYAMGEGFIRIDVRAD